MDAAPLNTDVFAVIAYFAADGLFPMTPAHPRAPHALGTATLRSPHRTGEVAVDLDAWADTPKAKRTWEEEATAFKVAFQYRRRLATLAALSGVCREWNAFLAPHWRAWYTQVRPLLRCVLPNKAQERALALVTAPPGPTPSPEWCRLAVKYAFKDGPRLARQVITVHRVKDTGRRFKPDRRPRTLYVTHDIVTQQRRLKPGRLVTPDTEEVEYRVAEKIVDGHAYWARKTLADIDAALRRQRAILAETRALARELAATRPRARAGLAVDG